MRFDTCTDPAIADGGAVAVANGIAESSADTARQLYVAILNAPTSTALEKRCAADGIVALVPEEAESATGLAAVLAGIQKGWDEFFAGVVDPAWALIVPFLVVLGLLLLLSRLLSRFTVGPNTHGARDRTGWTRTVSFLAHWLFGVGSLVAAAFLLTVGMALVARETPPEELTNLVGIYSIVMFVVGVGYVVALCKGKAPNLGRPFYGFYTAATVSCGLWWIFGRKVENGVDFYIAGLALLFAALGLWTVARGNGLQIGMLIEGRKDDGAADASVAQRVQAQLYAMTSSQPGQAGIMIPRDTDASIPDGAFDLVPEGTPAKALKAIAGALWPKSSWRTTVDAVGNGKVHLTIFRNGRYVDAATIRRSDFMPGGRTAPSSPCSSESHQTGDAAAETSMSGVWVGVSAFILVTLARRYPYIDAGIYGVRDWRSIAAQAVAADGTVSEREASRLLLAAVAFDGKNVAAELARINDQYGKAPDEDDQVIQQLTSLKGRLDGAELKESPMSMRLGFNLAVAHTNKALSSNPTKDRKVGGKPDSVVLVDWSAAARHIEEVLRPLFGESGKCFGRRRWSLPTPPADLEGFYDALRGPALGLGYLIAHSRVTPKSAMTKDRLVKDGLKNLGEMAEMELAQFERIYNRLEQQTTLARYERVCVHAYLADYAEVSKQLAAIAGSETIRKWAREDPSLDSWWTSGDTGDAYRALLDEPTTGIVNVGPFAAYQDQLTARGVSTADVLRRRASLLAAEIGLGNLVGDYWRRIAGFQVSLAGPDNLDPESDAVLLSRLLSLGIDSEAKLVAEIRVIPSTASMAGSGATVQRGELLAARLAPRKTGYAWKAPTADAFQRWADRAGRR